MENSVVDNAYFDWILNKIRYDDSCFDNVLNVLHETAFKSSMDNDGNRARDGYILRSIFMDEEGWNTEPDSGLECSCLEMMVALAMRIENDIMWDGEEDKTDKWFWIMIRNLGFEEFDDGETAEYIISRWLDRDSKFMLFPLKSGREEQNQREIWYQAQQYLMENYEF